MCHISLSHPLQQGCPKALCWGISSLQYTLLPWVKLSTHTASHITADDAELYLLFPPVDPTILAPLSKSLQAWPLSHPGESISLLQYKYQNCLLISHPIQGCEKSGCYFWVLMGLMSSSVLTEWSSKPRKGLSTGIPTKFLFIFFPFSIHTRTSSHFICGLGIALQLIPQLKCTKPVSLSAKLVISTWMFFELRGWRRINLGYSILQLSIVHTYDSERQYYNMREKWLIWGLDHNKKIQIA